VNGLGNLKGMKAETSTECALKSCGEFADRKAPSRFPKVPPSRIPYGNCLGARISEKNDQSFKDTSMMRASFSWQVPKVDN
jgi:hypothetical protein